MLKKSRASFDSSLLKSLLEVEDSCVSVISWKFELELSHIHVGNIKASIKEILDSRIASFDTELGGLILGYKNVKVLEPLHVEDNGINIEIIADIYLFKPTIGCTLKGVVNKKGKDHIGCLVLGVFNVVLPRPFEFDDHWKGLSAKLGQEVVFVVDKLDFSAVLPYIRGEIISTSNDEDGEEIDSGIGCVESVEDDYSPKKKKKKIKQEKELTEFEGQDKSFEDEYSTKEDEDCHGMRKNKYFDKVTSCSETSSSSPKKRKFKNLEGDGEYNPKHLLSPSASNETEEEESPSKKSKKKKKWKESKEPDETISPMKKVKLVEDYEGNLPNLIGSPSGSSQDLNSSLKGILKKSKKTDAVPEAELIDESRKKKKGQSLIKNYFEKKISINGVNIEETESKFHKGTDCSGGDSREPKTSNLIEVGLSQLSPAKQKSAKIQEMHVQITPGKVDVEQVETKSDKKKHKEKRKSKGEETRESIISHLLESEMSNVGSVTEDVENDLKPLRTAEKEGKKKKKEKRKSLETEQELSSNLFGGKQLHFDNVPEEDEEQNNIKGKRKSLVKEEKDFYNKNVEVEEHKMKKKSKRKSSGEDRVNDVITQLLEDKLTELENPAKSQNIADLSDVFNTEKAEKKKKKKEEKRKSMEEKLKLNSLDVSLGDHSWIPTENTPSTSSCSVKKSKKDKKEKRLSKLLSPVGNNTESGENTNNSHLNESTEFCAEEVIENLLNSTRLSLGGFSTPKSTSKKSKEPKDNTGNILSPTGDKEFVQNVKSGKKRKREGEEDHEDLAVNGSHKKKKKRKSKSIDPLEEMKQAMLERVTADFSSNELT